MPALYRILLLLACLLPVMATAQQEDDYRLIFLDTALFELKYNSTNIDHEATGTTVTKYPIIELGALTVRDSPEVHFMLVPLGHALSISPKAATPGSYYEQDVIPASAIRLSANTVAPGDTGYLSIRVNARIGHSNNFALFATHSGTIRISFSAQYLPDDVGLRPTATYNPTVQAGKWLHDAFVINNESRDTITLKQFRAPWNIYCETDLRGAKSVLLPGASRKIAFRYREDKPGYFSRRFSFTFTRSGRPETGYIPYWVRGNAL